MPAELRSPTVLRRSAAVKRYTEQRVRRELAAGRWTQHGRAVVTHNGPLSWEERLAVAIATVPAGRAAVDADSALFLTRRLEQPAQPQVALLGGTHRPVVPGVAFSWIGDLSGKTVLADRLPSLTPAYAALRAAATRPTEREARTVLCRALQRRAMDGCELAAALGPRPRLRHSAVAAEVLADFDGGIQSVPEKEFDLLRGRHRLPAAARQRRVQGRDGRYYLDAAYDEFGLGVEIHGWQHWEFAHREADNWRSAEIVAGGRRLLVFSSYAVRHEPRRVADLLRAALVSGGWRG